MTRRWALPEQVDVKDVLRRSVALVRASDVALAYGGIIVGVAVILAVVPTSIRDEVVLRSSTNLANLHEHPIYVLIISAFVVANLLGLVVVPFLMVAYAAAQHWLGRLGAIVAGVFGHVGATLFVATLLIAGIKDHVVSRSVAFESDVGVSYGLAAVAGMLAARVVPRWRSWYVAGLVVYFVGPLFVLRTFTGVGHTTALAIGFALAWIAHRAGRPAAPGEGQNAPS